MTVTRLLAIFALVGLLALSFGLPSTVLAGELPGEDLPDVRFEGGLVNKVAIMDTGFGKVIVDYTKFIITPDTEIVEDDGMLAMGAYVDVEAEHHYGKLLATKIVVLPEAPDTVRFEGGRITVLKLDMYKVVVEGTKFITTADTVIDEGLMVGDFVRVEADRVDWKLIATKITLIDIDLEE